MKKVALSALALALLAACKPHVETQYVEVTRIVTQLVTVEVTRLAPTIVVHEGLVTPRPPTSTPGLTVAPPPTQVTFGDGVWLVGRDIIPGGYQSQHGDNCWWERRSCLDGTADCVIAYDFANFVGQSVVEIRETDLAFYSEGCGTWIEQWR